MINHIISYLSKHLEHLLLSRPLVVDQLIFFYNFKSSHLTVQLDRLESKEGVPSLSLLSVSSFAISSLSACLSTIIISPICCKKPAIRYPTTGP